MVPWLAGMDEDESRISTWSVEGGPDLSRLCVRPFRLRLFYRVVLSRAEECGSEDGGVGALKLGEPKDGREGVGVICVCNTESVYCLTFRSGRRIQAQLFACRTRKGLESGRGR